MMLAANNLNIHLGGKPVVKDVNLRFEPGRVTAILGPNGAGKTSLIRALVGILPANGGSITLDDTALPPPAERSKRIGYLPQNGMPAWNVTARELIGLGRLPYRSQLSALDVKDTAAINAAMIAADVVHLAERTIETMSGGELARVNIARVLAGCPDWIIADEPLANLDPQHSRDIIKLLRHLAENGTGIIVVLHQLNEALLVADDVVLLRDGTVVAAGASSETLTANLLEATYGVAFRILLQDGQSAIVPRV